MPATAETNSSRISKAMAERADHWVLCKDIPTDVVVVVGKAKFSLHKFILVAKSNYLRKLMVGSKEQGLDRIDLSGTPGGPEIFEKAAKFCYGVNFEITVENVAALRCAAEYLQMTENYCNESLGRRAEEFLLQVALTSLPGAVVVLKSCQYLLPLAEELNIVQRCVGASSALACNEARLASRSPPDWWTEEFSILNIPFLEKVVSAMRARGAEPLSIARTLVTYSERQQLLDVVGHGDDRPDTPGTISIGLSDDPGDSALALTIRIQQRKLVESMADLLPSESDLENIAAALPINRFLCRLLRSALLLKAGSRFQMELEKRISAVLEHVTVEDLLLLSFNNSRREKLLDLESVTRIVSGFVANATTAAAAVSNKDEVCRDKDIIRNHQRSSSLIIHRVSKTVDAYLGEIAKDAQLSISMFNGIAILLAKGAREMDDDLYRAIDIFLKTHSSLDEIDREKVCSVMDPLRLSYEARIHASQNKRLPVQVVLHALYYDQLKLRSVGNMIDDAARIKSKPKQSNHQLQTDVTLIRENEALRSELAKMKLYISDLQGNAHLPIHHHQQEAAAAASVATTHYKKDPKPPSRKPAFFSSMSKTLGKLNPFRHGSKDTSTRVEDDSDIVIKPRRRRFSIS